MQGLTKYELQRRVALLLRERKNEDREGERKEKNQKNSGRLHAL